MKIQVVLFDERNIILAYKDFYSNPPMLRITQEYIDEYVKQGLKLEDCRKIEITKWDHQKGKNDTRTRSTSKKD